jgi:hypothetical protein
VKFRPIGHHDLDHVVIRMKIFGLFHSALLRICLAQPFHGT